MIAMLLAVALAQSPGPSASAPVTFDPPPRVGVETVVTLVDPFGAPDAGATMQVVHRPGLPGERQRAIGITDSRGRVRWVPETGGVAMVKGPDDSVRVRIDRAEAPASTITLLALLAVAAAGFVGYGGLPRRFRRPAEPR